jgi:hypothetical protein
VLRWTWRGRPRAAGMLPNRGRKKEVANRAVVATWGFTACGDAAANGKTT